MPSPLVWAAPGEAPPELVCLVSHFYPSEGLEVEWELRGGPEGSFQKAKGQRWLSALHHHSDESVSLSGHLQPSPVTTAQHGARYACRVYHPSLPALGRSAEVTLEVAGKVWRIKNGCCGWWVPGKILGAHSYLSCPPGLSGPSLEDGVGLFLSAFLLLGLFKALGWAGECEHHPGQTLRWQAFSTYSQKLDTHFSLLPLPYPIRSPSLSTAAYLSTSEESKKVTALHLSLLSHFIPFPQLLTQWREAAGMLAESRLGIHTDLG